MTTRPRIRTLTGLIAVLAGLSSPFVYGSVASAESSTAVDTATEQLDRLRTVLANDDALSEAPLAESIVGGTGSGSDGLPAFPEGIATCVDSPIDAFWGYGDIASCGASLSSGN